MQTSRRDTLKMAGAGGAASVAGCMSAPTEEQTRRAATQSEQTSTPAVDRVAADPTELPAPIDRDEPRTVEVELTARELRAEVEDGVVYDYMTFDGQIPGPMLRVRQGDTVDLTFHNHENNARPHNVDFHAAYGTGGGAEATTAAPGESQRLRFKATYPGAFIYHCAVANMDMHISAGMFGMLLVEPKEGLPEVDRELYFGQHELYTDTPVGESGHHRFDLASMKREDPTYVLLNGQQYAVTPDGFGAPTVQQGERVRVFMVDGGPNLSSNFHPIGNVWASAHRDGAFETPEKNVQTMKVPPGSCMVGEMETPVPETIKLVDHALSRVARRGLLGIVQVEGEPDPEIFDPEPDA